MSSLRCSFLIVACAFGLVAAEPPRLLLSDGSAFEAARIIAITGEKVTIVHAGGVSVVDASLVDLQALARAHMQLEDAASARKLRAEEAAKKAAQQIAAADAEKAETLAVRRAMAAAYEKRQQQPAPARAAPQARPPISIEAEIMRLKAAFPAKVPGSARVFIPRSGRNESPYIVSSSLADLPDGRQYARTTTRHNAGPGRIDTIQYDAPPDEVWRWYKSMLQTTTSQALPRTLQMIEGRLAEDTAKFRSQIGGSSASGSAQAQHTLHWFERTLKPHLESWRSLTR